MATGPIMAIGAVDMLIPPSALTVLLGSLSGISISKLLIGGVVPGLMLSVAFVGYIVIRVRAQSVARAADPDRGAAWLGEIRSCWSATCCRSFPIFVVVVGAMSGGSATPTEVGGARRARNHGAGHALPCADARRPDERAAGHGRGIRHDPVHHPRRHDVLADPELLRRDRGHRLGRSSVRACRRSPC